MMNVTKRYLLHAVKDHIHVKIKLFFTTLFVVILILLSSLVFADNKCEELFESANKINELSLKYSIVSEDKFNEMKDLISSKASDDSICIIGRESRMSAYLSAKSFGRARDRWQQAENYCDYSNAKNAKESFEKNVHAIKVQADFIKKMDDVLHSKCNYPPLTPLLNTN